MTSVRYVGSAESLAVSHITSWDRGDILEQEMSASSGPKDYLKNDVWLLFNVHPQINRVALVRSAGALFFLMRDEQNCWFDVKGRQVTSL